MKINSFTIKQGFFSKSEINTYIENKITKQSKYTVETLKDSINTQLDDKPKQSNKLDVSSTIDAIMFAYGPIECDMKALARYQDAYNKGTEALKNPNLTETQKNDIQFGLNESKKHITYFTSPERIKMWDNYLNSSVVPAMNDLKSILEKETVGNSDASKFEIKSMEDLGAKNTNRSDFGSILDESSNLINNFLKKRLALFDIDEKYGAQPNREITRKSIIEDFC